MTKPGRLPCVNPACRRTACAEQFGERDIICRKCWNLLPLAVRNRYQQLRRREKRLLRLIGRRATDGTIRREVIDRIQHRITDQAAENWQLMRDYFRTSKKPLGLEGFLQEMGL